MRNITAVAIQKLTTAEDGSTVLVRFEVEGTETQVRWVDAGRWESDPESIMAEVASQAEQQELEKAAAVNEAAEDETPKSMRAEDVSRKLAEMAVAEAARIEADQLKEVRKKEAAKDNHGT